MQQRRTSVSFMDTDLPEAAVEHISQMLTLAKSKHLEAMALLGTPVQNALPRLQEVLKLLDEVELLADDAATYVDADVMKAAINNLHVQQASVKMAIAQLQALKTRSPWATPWPWLALIILAWLIVQAVG
jgi:hypothetical protein